MNLCPSLLIVRIDIGSVYRSRTTGSLVTVTNKTRELVEFRCGPLIFTAPIDEFLLEFFPV